MAKANQSLQTLERFRRRLDDALERLTRMEVSDVASNRAVVTVVQRAELVRRLGAEIDRDAVNLGASGEIIRLQLADLVQGVETQRSLTLRDYVRPSRTATARTALEALGALAVAELNDPSRVAAAVGLDDLDDHVRPLGYRLLASVPRLPENVRNALTGHFKDFQKMLLADVAELDDVEGIGTSAGGPAPSLLRSAARRHPSLGPGDRLTREGVPSAGALHSVPVPRPPEADACHQAHPERQRRARRGATQADALPDARAPHSVSATGWSTPNMAPP